MTPRNSPNTDDRRSGSTLQAADEVIGAASDSGRQSRWKSQAPRETEGYRSEPPQPEDVGTKATVETVEIVALQDEVESPDLADRQHRAQARALFDSGSLKILEHLAKVNQFPTSEVQDLPGVPKGEEWLKLACLMRAEFIEVIGSNVRLTDDGRDALRKLNQFVTRIEQQEDEASQ